MKHSKIAVGASVVAAASLSLAACSSGGNDNQSDSTSAKTEITWDMWAGGQEDIDWVEQTAAIAQAANPDITIKTQTASWSDYFTKLTTNMSSGNLACITSMNGQRLSGFASALSPLTDEDLATAGISKTDYADGSLEIMTYDGNLYGIPYDIAAMMVFYNQDILDETGTKAPTNDWTFDDFVSIAQDTTTDTHKGFGMAMGEFQWMSLPIAMSGVQGVDESGKLDLTNDKFVEASEWYASLATELKVADPVPSASDTGWGEEQYKAGNVAMAVDGTWNASSYFGNEVGFTAGAVRLPTGDNGSLGLVLGSGFGIASTCEGSEREAALKVLGSLVGKDAQDLLASSGRSYPSLIESQPKYFESLPEEYSDQVQTAFEAAFKNVEGQRTVTNWDQVNNYIQPNLVSVYTGQEKISTVLEQAQTQFGGN